MTSTNLVKMHFGSTIYGTRLPTSDLDMKGVFIPSHRDIILQRDPKVIKQNTKPPERTKNNQDDIDVEMFSVKKYLELLTEGQTVSLDMIFCPKEYYIEGPGYYWLLIQKHKYDFLHKGVTSFVSYCRTQASKYGIKGSRMGELKEAIEFFKRSDQTNIGSCYLPYLVTSGKEHIKMIDVFDTSQNKNISMIEICNRKFPLNLKVEYVLNQLTKIYDQYGHRAKAAELNEGIDWKALMHAVRVCKEAEELLTTGNITFPRPEKDLLLQIRKGELAYKQVAEIIESGLVTVEEAKNKSTLRESPNFKLMEDLVYEIYDKQRNRS